MRRLSQKGSILIFLTLGFALLGTFIGFAVDFGRAYLEKARISRLVDAASLAAAKALKGQAGFEDEATRAACDSMVANGAPVIMSGTGVCEATTGAPFTVALSFFDKAVAGGPPIRHVAVTGTEPMPTTFLRFLGWMTPGDFSTLNVAATAQAAPERPIDLMLVLDRSGSMTATDGTGTPKINALKTAVNAFLGLSNTFSANDRIGMVSFASRGCASSSGGESTAANCSPDVALDYADSSHISGLQNKVNGLNANGGTNPMEAFQTARTPLAQAFDDPNRATTRKAVLFVTDGQPTFMKRNNTNDCRRDPKTGALLPSPGDSGNFPDGCKQGVPVVNDPADRFYMFRGSVTTTGLTAIPPSSASPNSIQSLYLNTISCTRSLMNCVTNGAMYEANLTRNCGYSNSACTGGGNHDVVIFSIAIGKKDLSEPQQSMDENAKCMLARMSNADDILNAATGVVEKLATVCNQVYSTMDGDSHADLKAGCAGDCTVDNTQEKGKVFVIDVTGDVTAQLNQVFNDIASLLKLRLVL
ncbi:MAG: VWA domain-containing protein [Candidatus Binatia bacterium]